MSIFKIAFERLSGISDIETIGKINNPFIRDWLNKKYGRANWIYKKGNANLGG